MATVTADRHYTAEIGLYGPITRAEVDLILDDVLASVERHGAYMGGGFVETDDAGVPLHLTPFWRWVWRVAENVQHVAFIRGYRR